LPDVGRRQSRNPGVLADSAYQSYEDYEVDGSVASPQKVERHLHMINSLSNV